MPGPEKEISWQDSLKALADLMPQEEKTNLSDEQTENASASEPVQTGRLDIVYERKGRAGKPATIIAGFSEDFPDDEIERLAASMKKSMGCGGSCRGGEILLQGDRRDAAMKYLTNAGYKARII